MRYNVSQEATWVKHRIAELEANTRKNRIPTLDVACFAPGSAAAARSHTPPSSGARPVDACKQSPVTPSRPLQDEGTASSTHSSQTSRPPKCLKNKRRVCSITRDRSKTADHHQQRVRERRLVRRYSHSGYKHRPLVTQISYDDQVASATSRIPADTAASIAGQRNRLGDGHPSVCSHIKRALHEAEKRGDWLRGELNVVTACATEEIRQLEQEIADVRKTRHDRAAAPSTSIPHDGNGLAQRVRRYSTRDEESKSKLSQTSDAIKNLRRKFFRVLRDRDRLESKCERLSKELQQQQQADLFTKRTPLHATWHRLQERQHQHQQRSRRREQRQHNQQRQQHQAWIWPAAESDTNEGRRVKSATNSIKSSRSSRSDGFDETRTAAHSSQRSTRLEEDLPPGRTNEWRWPSSCEGEVAAPAWGTG